MEYRPGERDFSEREYLTKRKNRALFKSLTLKQLFHLYELACEFDENDNSLTSQQLVAVIEEYVSSYTTKTAKFGIMAVQSKFPGVRKALTFFVLSVADVSEELALHIFRTLLKDDDPAVRQYARRQVHERLEEAAMGDKQYALQLIPELRESEVADAVRP